MEEDTIKGSLLVHITTTIRNGRKDETKRECPSRPGGTSMYSRKGNRVRV